MLSPALQADIPQGGLFGSIGKTDILEDDLTAHGADRLRMSAIAHFGPGAEHGVQAVHGRRKTLQRRIDARQRTGVRLQAIGIGEKYEDGADGDFSGDHRARTGPQNDRLGESQNESGRQAVDAAQNRPLLLGPDRSRREVTEADLLTLFLAERLNDGNSRKGLLHVRSDLAIGPALTLGDAPQGTRKDTRGKNRKTCGRKHDEGQRGIEPEHQTQHEDNAQNGAKRTEHQELENFEDDPGIAGDDRDRFADRRSAVIAQRAALQARENILGQAIYHAPSGDRPAPAGEGVQRTCEGE
jgi:hypothetical protein